MTLVPDVLTAGERIYSGRQAFQTAPFEDLYPDWSMVGKMIADHRYGVELLRRLEFVDASRIAAIGHSLGGYNAFFLAAAEERICAVVCSCGFSTFAGDAVPGRWGNRKEWFTHFPKLDARDHFMGLIGSYGHQFPRPIRKLAYEWLEKELLGG